MNVHIDTVNIYEKADPAVAGKLEQVLTLLAELRDFAVTNQETINAIAQALDEAAAAITADITALEAAVKAGETLDFSPLLAKADALKAIAAEHAPK